MRGLKIAALSILGGCVSSFVYNAGVWVWLSRTDPDAQGAVSHILLAPGLALAGRGFEERMMAVPLNVISFAAAFSIVIWLLVRHKYSVAR